jgi:flagellar biosynthesis chaperone FliJ
MATYPLEQVARIKQKRLDEAQRLLKQRKEELEEQERLLKKAEDERDVKKRHHKAKLQQLREAMDAGEGSVKIEGMKAYLKVVQAELKAKEKVVEEQREKVQEAEKLVEEARAEMIKREHDVEKLREHRKEWDALQLKERLAEEAEIGDEIGTVRHVRRQNG